jgi:Asp-tRNA(Asn)/Glu-tRNA(Gln) amidotransferase A subunit family amidase
MSASGSDETGAALARAVAALGVAPAQIDPAGLAPLLDRVAAGVGSLDALAAAGVAPPGGGERHQPVAGGSPWVWQAELPPTGPGPLAGVRVAVKDLVAVAGRPLWAGSASRLDAPAERADAAVVAALRAAGARVVGAVKLHEFAFGVTGLNAVFGTAANPAAPGRVPGGSSSGSGAVIAAGEADLAIGTDTGGSVRIPAALCGVVGYKPAFGAIATTGVLPLAPSLDHVGFLGAGVAAVVAAAAAAGVAGLAAGAGSAPLCLGVVRSLLAGCDPDVAAGFEATLARLGRAGVTLVEVDRPPAEAAFAATTAIMFAEAAWVHRRHLAARWDDYGADVRNRLVQGLALRPEVVVAAQRLQRSLRQQYLDVLGGVDAVLTPTVPTVPPRLDEAADPAVAAQLVSHTRLANLTGVPALSLPVPGTPLPVGLQLEAASDTALVRAATRVEAVLFA